MPSMNLILKGTLMQIFSHISRAHFSHSKKCFNVEPSTYYFHMKTKIMGDSRICISVLLSWKNNNHLNNLKTALASTKIEVVPKSNWLDIRHYGFWNIDWINSCNTTPRVLNSSSVFYSTLMQPHIISSKKISSIPLYTYF